MKNFFGSFLIALVACASMLAAAQTTGPTITISPERPTVGDEVIVTITETPPWCPARLWSRLDYTDFARRNALSFGISNDVVIPLPVGFGVLPGQASCVHRLSYTALYGRNLTPGDYSVSVSRSDDPAAVRVTRSFVVNGIVNDVPAQSPVGVFALVCLVLGMAWRFWKVIVR
jgi:hypothetical protein